MNYKPRNVYNIVNIIIEIIPLDQIKLKKELETFSHSLWNKSPEEIIHSPLLWSDLCIILNNNIETFDLDLEWQKTIRDIVNNKIELNWTQILIIKIKNITFYYVTKTFNFISYYWNKVFN